MSPTPHFRLAKRLACYIEKSHIGATGSGWANPIETSFSSANIYHTLRKAQDLQKAVSE